MESGPFIIVLIVLSNIENGQARRSHVYLGGIFAYDDLAKEAAFHVAVLDAAQREQVALRPAVKRLEGKEADGALDAADGACQLIEQGVVGILGSYQLPHSEAVQSVCDLTEVPHITTTMDGAQARNLFLINVHPHPEAYSSLLTSLVKSKGWSKYTIMYEDSDGLARVSGLIHQQGPDNVVSVTQLKRTPVTNYIPVLQNVKSSGAKNFVLDCRIEILDEILRQALMVGILSNEHSYIIATPDTHTLDMDPYKYGGANITGIRLVNSMKEKVEEFQKKFEVTYAKLLWESGMEVDHRVVESPLRVDIALVYDAVMVYTAGLRQIFNFRENSQATQVNTPSCETPSSWIHGSTIVNYVRLNIFTGLTGEIVFNPEGRRMNASFEIVELGPDGIEKIGNWDGAKLTFERKTRETERRKDTTLALKNMTFIVITSLTEPFGMLKRNTVKLYGNDRFEGFGIELIDEIAKLLGFKYTFIIQDDSVYGRRDKETDTWDGMIGKVLNQEADLAIADLTITSDREDAVDFTSVFMNTGISILYKSPTKATSGLFSFMDPFSLEVWLCVGAAYVSMSLLMWMLGRLSPGEWKNPYPCVEEPEELCNQFSIYNSFWFTLGSILQQGSVIAPITTSIRLIGAVWWFFTLVMTSSYTANLAAFLTLEINTSPINNAEQLANQDIISYGAKINGSTMSFFQESSNSVYKKMSEYIAKNPHMLMKTNQEGVERVKSTNYAFLMESTSIEYTKERECDVTQIGGLLDSKGYGIAMRKNSSYRTELSAAVLKLQERGVLTHLKKKWWKDRRGGGICQHEEQGDKQPLTLDNMGGVFVILACGCFIGVIVSFFDMIMATYQKAKDDETPFRYVLLEELRFVAKFSGQMKPIRLGLRQFASQLPSPVAPRSRATSLIAVAASRPISHKNRQARRISLNRLNFAVSKQCRNP